MTAALAGTLAWAQHSAAPLPDGVRADRVVVNKSAHRLELYRGTELLRSYSVSLGRGPAGPKQHEGDGRTPEGRTEISRLAPQLHHEWDSPQLWRRIRSEMIAAAPARKPVPVWPWAMAARPALRDWSSAR